MALTDLEEHLERNIAELENIKKLWDGEKMERVSGLATKAIAKHSRKLELPGWLAVREKRYGWNINK